MANDKFKLPGSSYTELTRIIQAYGHAPKNASPQDVATRAAMGPTQISRSNGFLVSVGILEGGRTKSLTLTGENLAKALDHGISGEIETAWRNIVNDNDFLRQILSAVKIRSGMDVVSLRSHIAFTAGQAKSSPVMAGAGAIIKILEVAGYLSDQNGKIVANARNEDQDQLQEDEENINVDNLVDPDVSPEVSHKQIIAKSGVSLAIEVRINCGPDDIENLGQKLKSLINDLSDPEEPVDDSTNDQ